MRRTHSIIRTLTASLALAGSSFLLSTPAFAHCDGMDGPVVLAAQEALAKGDVNLVLIWVGTKDEAEIRRAFDHTVSVRKLGPQAKELADTYFFESLVRIHRAGEGAPYSGLKPAGRDLGPVIPAADRSLKSGDAGPLTNLVIDQVRAGLLERYKDAMAAKDFKSQDLDAGREFVKKYITFIHYAEGLYLAAVRPAEGHPSEEAAGPHHEE